MTPRRAWKSRRSGQRLGSALPKSGPPAHLCPRRNPRQPRARETVLAILGAAAELFAADGYAGTTTNRIAERAGVSIGSLYQYFPNKDSILVRLHDDHLAEVRTLLDASLPELADPGVPLETAFRGLLHRFVELHEAEPEVTRALTVNAIHLARKEAGNDREDYAPVVAKILSARPDVRSGDHALMARLVGEVFESAVRWVVHEAPHSLDRRAAMEEIVGMLAAYLKARRT